MENKTYRGMKLYPEIKNAMREVMTSEENGREWMKIAREQLADVRTLIAASKKLSKDTVTIPQQVIDFVRAEIEAEKNAPEIENDSTEEPAETDEIPQTPEAV